jgi:tRNA G18 (ribose-2'-O)-methylase SpoU
VCGFFLSASSSSFFSVPCYLLHIFFCVQFTVEPRSKRDMMKLTGDRVHQNLVLECDPFPILDDVPVPNAEENADEPAMVRVVLDSLTDPHNVGSGM